MATLVLTVIGDDKSGLVEALAAVITEHRGNWDRSHMSHLAGKFAGIVQVTVPAEHVDALTAALAPLEADGLLDVTAELADPEIVATEAMSTFRLEVVGQDHPGIVHEVSRVLADSGLTIDELETDVSAAPMAGGTLFTARATLRAPASLSLREVETQLDGLADELMVDIDLSGGA